MSEQETHADIIAEMRMFKCRNLETGELELCNAIGNHFADRLEAAWKRELSKICPKTGGDFGQLGNAAKLREALQKAAESAAEIMERVRHKDGLAFNTANYIAGVARTALAAPPRNCEVGTVEQQAKRFAEYCESEVCKRNRCKYRAKALCIERCALAWAQMLYESEVGK